jgi:hypothetical protein
MSRRRYVRRRRRSYFRRTLVIAVAAIALLEAVLLTRHQHQSGAPAVTTSHQRSFPPITQTGHFRDFARPIYPLSVIRGGAYTSEEANAAIDRDPVVASHYAVFQRAQLKTARSPFTHAVYVSYRRGNDIYWTRRPIALHQHETLLTDGVSYARARCGNRISLTQQLPVSDDEPASDVLDSPEADDFQQPALLEAAVPLDTGSLSPAIASSPGGVLPSKFLASPAIWNPYIETFWPRFSAVIPAARHAVALNPAPSPIFPIVLQLPVLWPTPAYIAFTAQPPPSSAFPNISYIAPGIVGNSVLEINPLPVPVFTRPDFHDDAPEPASLAMISAGIAILLGLIGWRRAFRPRT